MAEKSQRGANLSREDRERGGRTSAAKQERDARGQFAGTKGKAKSRGRNDDQQNQQGGSHNQNIEAGQDMADEQGAP